MTGYLTLIVGLLAVIGSVWVSVWLARRHQFVPGTSDAGDGLRRGAKMLGLDDVRESQLFQARVLTAWGEVNEFRINCELWEQVQTPFYRVTIGFPQPLRRGIRISRDANGGLMQRVLDEDAEKNSTNEDILVQSKQNIGELRSFLQDDLRQPLEHLAARVSRMQMGDEYLYLYVKSPPDGAFCESVLRESMAVATKIFSRAMVLGPSKSTKKTSSYGQAKSEMSRRISDSVVGEPRDEPAPQTRRITLAAMAAVSGDEVVSAETVGEQTESVWARKPVEVAEVREVEMHEQQADAESEPKKQLDDQVEANRSASATLRGVGMERQMPEEL